MEKGYCCDELRILVIMEDIRYDRGNPFVDKIETNPSKIIFKGWKNNKIIHICGRSPASFSYLVPPLGNVI